MDYKEFTGEVQHRIEADSQGEAVRTTRAALTTLGERVQADEAKDLASPLPMEIDRYLTAADSGQRFDYQEFLTRVAERGSVERAEAAFRVQAVIALVAEVVPVGELEDVEEGLPAEFEDLFEFVDAEEAAAPW